MSEELELTRAEITQAIADFVGRTRNLDSVEIEVSIVLGPPTRFFAKILESKSGEEQND